jgi:cell division protein YceG involved in septum cleavage
VGTVSIANKKYTIEKGYTVTVLNDKLGFGVASWRYRLWLKFFAPQNIAVNAGTYETKDSINIETFLTKTLTKPLYIDQTITILPGWSIYDIDTYITSK